MRLRQLLTILIGQKKITSNSDDELDAIRTQVINRLKK